MLDMAAMETLQFTVRPDVPDADAEELDRLTRELLHDLREQPVETADLVRGGPPPAGTKALDMPSAEILVLVGTHSIKLILDIISRKRATVRFEGRLRGQQVKFEGAAKEFAKLLATLTEQATKAR
jgi:hypothetical protein